MKFEDYERCFSKIRKGDLLFTIRGYKREAKTDAYYSATNKRWEVMQGDPDGIAGGSIRFGTYGYDAFDTTIYCGIDFFFTRIVKAPRG